MNPERIIKFLLILMGISCVPAIIPAVMPLAWIQGTHEWLGLGEFPEQPIAEYLARGMSVLCAFYGGLVLVLSRDVRRFLPIIRYQAIYLCVVSPLGGWMAMNSGIESKYFVIDALGGLVIMLPVLILSLRIKDEA